MEPKYTQADIDKLFNRLLSGCFNEEQNAVIYKIFVQLKLKDLPDWQENIGEKEEKALARMCRNYDFSIPEEENDEDIKAHFDDWWHVYTSNTCFDPSDYEFSPEFVFEYCKAITEKHKKKN